MYLYHSTFRHYLNSIKREGLIANKNKTWGDCDYGVYLANDIELARSFSETIIWTLPMDIDDVVVLKIDINMLEKDLLVDDPHIIWEENSDNHKTYLYKSNIPIKAIVD